MIKWCAFCQRFQGEIPPFERLDVSHGLCSRCSKGAFEWTSEEERRVHRLGDYSRRFWKAGRDQNRAELEKLIDEAIHDGIRPIDLLYGLAAPALAKVGDLWARNVISVEEEHQFTRTCEVFVELIAHQIHEELAPSRILLANVPGNEHTLGLRFTQLGLSSIGLASELMPAGGTLREILDRATQMKAQTVGLSVSMREQLPSLLCTVEALTRAGFSTRIIVSGGAAIKAHRISQESLPKNVLLMTPVFDESERGLFLGDSREKVTHVGS